MKLLAVSILLFLMMSQAFKGWFIIGGYRLNKSYISSTLCENKNRPAMHCNGKCVLMKKILAAENESSPNLPLKLTWDAPLFLLDHTEYPTRHIPGLQIKHCSLVLNLCPRPFCSGVFRPPLA